MSEGLGQEARRQEARRLITERCLIAADVDKTLVAQGEAREESSFLETVAPELLKAASDGTHLAFLTGNSMDELSDRFLRWLVRQICHSHPDRPDILERFHFFCNSGGVYAHFPGSILGQARASAASGTTPAERLFDEMTAAASGGKKLAIRPCFVDASYIERCRIPDPDAQAICGILTDAAARYFDRFGQERSRNEEIYDLSEFAALFDAGKITPPEIDVRRVAYGADTPPKQAAVQITLKPVLSFRFARRPAELFDKDIRSKIISDIQDELDRAGLGHYIARPGGRSSIDITLEKLDKAYALEFLIDRLELQGHSRRGQKLGSNAIYFGDEVIVGGGNDYPVTRIPGLLVFAVNSDHDLVPLRFDVFVPDTTLEGPDATADVLRRFNSGAKHLLSEYVHAKERPSHPLTAIEHLKVEIFASRVRTKIAGQAQGLLPEDWQTLHAFVTLICRSDPAAREWLNILSSELDAISTYLAASKVFILPAIGVSHPDR